MAAQFITLIRSDANATHSARILAVSKKAKELRNELADLVAESFQMFDGEGAEQFTLPKTKYGTSTNAEAQVVFNKMNETLGALNGLPEIYTRIG